MKFYIHAAVLCVLLTCSENASSQFQLRRAVTSEYYVDANNGDDSNVGSPAEPFKTISKATSVMNSHDTCIIRHGWYNEIINVNKSGLTYKAFEGERPRIVAGELFSQDDGDAVWTQVTGTNYYVADFDAFDGIEADALQHRQDSFQMFVLDQAMVEARWPDISYPLNGGSIGGGDVEFVHMPRNTAGPGTDHFKVCDLNLQNKFSAGDLAGGALVHIVPGAEWVSFTKRMSLNLSLIHI